MKITLKVNPEGVNQYHYDDLEDLISEYVSLNNTVDHIVDNSSPSNMKRYLQILLEQIQRLEHHEASTVGLWATDKDPADKSLFFQITQVDYPTEIN